MLTIVLIWRYSGNHARLGMANERIFEYLGQFALSERGMAGILIQSADTLLESKQTLVDL